MKIHTLLLLLLACQLATVNAAPNPSHITAIRERYAEINAAELKWDTLKPPFEDEYSGSFKRGTIEGKVVKTVLDFNMGDHGGSTAETYYDKNGAPVFLFHFSSYWGFTGKKEGGTEDRVTERRIYFHDTNIVRALEKKYVFKQESEKQAAASAANNLSLEYSSQASARFLTPLNELRTAKAPKVVVLAEQLDRAVVKLTDTPIPNDPDQWSPVKVPAKRLTQDKLKSAADAAFGILLALNILQEGENAEHPDFTDTDILEKTKDQATVVITLDGLKDDELKAVRYRIELAKKLKTWQLMAIGQQTQKWPDRSEGGTSEWKKPPHRD